MVIKTFGDNFMKLRLLFLELPPLQKELQRVKIPDFP